MYGAIIGDIVGSIYEFENVRSKDILLFDPLMRFTDDTILTVATMDVLLNPDLGYAEAYKKYFREYYENDRGFGSRFIQWGLNNSNDAYHSFGNSSAMRVSPIAYAFETAEEVLAEAKRSAEVTHNHLEGIKGAHAIALAIFHALKGMSKIDIELIIEDLFEYDLMRTIEEIRFTNEFDETYQDSVPEAITCFLRSEKFEDCIRTAISIGGDSDTIACMAGSIAEAFYYPIDQKWIKFADDCLDDELQSVVHEFYQTFKIDENLS